MQRLHRNNTDNLHEKYAQHVQFDRSPLRRHTANYGNPTRSPIRSRTPTRHVSPLKNTSPMPSSIKFIANVSPVREKRTNHENQSEFSNGKSLKYINSNITDKIYQTIKQDKMHDYNKKSERTMNENNKLFSKLVDKMTSGKKPAFRGQENHYKTSVFADNSEGRPNKMEPSSVKTEGGVFKQLFNQVSTAEPRMEKRSSSKQKTVDTVSESEGLSCIVYKMKTHPKGETQDLKSKLMENSKAKEGITANIPAILLKRKQSRPDSVVEEAKQLQNQKKHQRVEESQDFSDFNVFLHQIEHGCVAAPVSKGEDLVKMSFKVEQSLNMDPFL